MKINYQRIMEQEIEKIKDNQNKPTLLLHACCAPCTSAVLEYLDKYFAVTLFFYNPNIAPESEFDFRLEELKRLVVEMKLQNINIVTPQYDPKEFEDMAEGLHDIPEGGARCKKCYRLRLRAAVEYAAENHFDYVTTTLSVSPHKNADWLNEIGMELAESCGTKYLCSDFKKKEGYKRSIELSRQYNLYRQNYCGCIYSKKQSEMQNL